MINTEVNSIDEIINIIKTSKKQIYRFDTDSNKNATLKKETLNNLQKFKNFCESKLNLSSKNINQNFTGINCDTYSGNVEIFVIGCCYSLSALLPDSYSQAIDIRLLIFNKYKDQPLNISYQLWVANDRLIHVNNFDTFESKFKEWLESED